MIDEEYDAQAFDSMRLESLVNRSPWLASWLRHAFRGGEHCNQVFIVKKVIGLVLFDSYKYIASWMQYAPPKRYIISIDKTKFCVYECKRE